ncbi:hypothetical protein P9597_07610 [Aneurinibacillus migulanus]|uniref:hypothetical protein n=1 Tax=Aneurinibacillus migulanus TaxID=47500 RepID=UPI002E21F1A4|nr:hypothetical protein [Aneurinibacillus migulanus]
MRNMQEAARKVVVLNTDGTIAMSVDDDTDAVKPGEVHPLHTIEPLLKQYGQVEIIDITVTSDKPVMMNTHSFTVGLIR